MAANGIQLMKQNKGQACDIPIDGHYESRAGFHIGPIASKSTRVLKKTFDGFPDAIDPVESKTNQANTPKRTALLTFSGALSYTILERSQIVTPQPRRNPPVRAERNRVSGESYVDMPSTGQLKKSKVHRAGSEVASIVPRKNTGPNEPTTKAVTFNHDL